MMMEFYPIHFYGYENENNSVASIKYDRKKSKLCAYDGYEWVELQTAVSFYYFERITENMGKIYLIDGDTISNICNIREDTSFFQEGDVLLDIIHGNYLQLLGEYWVVRYSGEKKEIKEVQELRKIVLELMKELKDIKKILNKHSN